MGQMWREQRMLHKGNVAMLSCQLLRGYCKFPFKKKNIHLCRVLHATDRCQVVCKAKRKMDRQECPCWGGRKLNMEGEEQAERGRERTRTFREGDGSGVEWSTSRHSRRRKCQGKALQS